MGVCSSDVGRVKWRFWEQEWMTGQSEAEEISWDGARTGEPQHQTARTARTARTAGQASGDSGRAAPALGGGLAVWQVGNAWGGGK